MTIEEAKIAFPRLAEMKYIFAKGWKKFQSYKSISKATDLEIKMFTRHYAYKMQFHEIRLKAKKELEQHLGIEIDNYILNIISNNPNFIEIETMFSKRDRSKDRFYKRAISEGLYKGTHTIQCRVCTLQLVEQMPNHQSYKDYRIERDKSIAETIKKTLLKWNENI